MSLEKEVAELIANEVSWFNGWKASEEMFNKSCRKAARSVIKRLTKRALDSATPCPDCGSKKLGIHSIRCSRYRPPSQ